jgi:hypothetical protein
VLSSRSRCYGPASLALLSRLRRLRDLAAWAIDRGTTEAFAIPVKETADTSETIQDASLIGGAAASFKVLFYFPIAVPNGQDVTIEVQFASSNLPTFEAELMLQTARWAPRRFPSSPSAFEVVVGNARLFFDSGEIVDAR